MVNVNDFVAKTDNEAFELAIQNRQADGIVLVPPRRSQYEPERSFYLLDSAVLLPENTTILLQNCTIKLSDKCRDNFFRTANCGMGIEFPKRISNVHIRGEGVCTLLGADHPRATGDGSKALANPCPYEVDDLCRLADWIPPELRTPERITFLDRHDHSYGTDAGTDESQYGDWRGIGILFANTQCFSIENIRIVESHGWGISLEACSDGRIERIRFDSCMSKMIDGLRSNMENQDGIDIRNGCHDIFISDISGKTGDDVIALTAIADDRYCPGGSVRTTHVMHNDWSKRDRNIHDIIIRNVKATSELCLIVRLLPANARIWNIIIDGVMDTTPHEKSHWATIALGEDTYGENLVDGLRGILISNVICNADTGIGVYGYLRDSVISGVVNMRQGKPLLYVEKKNGLSNVKIENIVQVQ